MACQPANVGGLTITKLHATVAKLCLLLGPAGLVPALGGCLPENFFANLAGQVTTTTVNAILDALLTAAGLASSS